MHWSIDGPDTWKPAAPGSSSRPRVRAKQLQGISGVYTGFTSNNLFTGD